MVVIIMMAYPLSKNKREYKPRNFMMWALIFCMLFNGGTIPWFITVKTYGLMNTMAALVLAGSVPVLFTSVGFWNEFFQGLVLMNSDDMYPLQTYIKQIVVQIPVGVTLTAEQYQQLNQNSNKALEAAKVFIAMIPMLIVYPFLQKYFVNGITLGAVKE